jgi:hypothetical protein
MDYPCSKRGNGARAAPLVAGAVSGPGRGGKLSAMRTQSAYPPSATLEVPGPVSPERPATPAEPSPVPGPEQTPVPDPGPPGVPEPSPPEQPEPEPPDAPQPDPRGPETER